MATYVELTGDLIGGRPARAGQTLRDLSARATELLVRTRRAQPTACSGPLTAEHVAGAGFASTSFREGYRQREVDAFLARAALSLRERAAGRPGPLSADDVVVIAFPLSRLRPGYDQAEVDEFLDRLVQALA